MSLEWSEAFRLAGITLVYTCLWCIVGFIIMMVGTLTGDEFIEFVCFITGSIIIYIGTFASVIKISVDKARS